MWRIGSGADTSKKQDRLPPFPWMGVITLEMQERMAFFVFPIPKIVLRKVPQEIVNI